MKAFSAVLVCASIVTATSTNSPAVDSVKNDPVPSAIHSTSSQYSTYIGIAGGFTSGYGLSLRKWFDNKWGLQLTLFPLYMQEKKGTLDDQPLSDSGYSNSGQLSLGVLYLRKLTDFRFGRVTYYAGGNVLMFYNKYDYYSQEWDGKYDTMGRYTPSYKLIHNTGKDFTKEITLGTGAGSEFYIWRFALHILLGLRASYELEHKNFTVMPTIEGGVQFRLF
jgi:hypothetical protein